MSEKPMIAFGYDSESVTYLDLLTEDYVSKWSDGQGSVTHTRITDFGGRTLFGDAPTLILKLEDKEAVKSTLDYLKSKTDEELVKRFPSGVFIRTQVALNSTKSLRDYLTKSGFEVHSKNKNDRQELPEELLERTSLSSEVKKFLLDFSRGEPEHVVGLVRQVSKLNKKQQAALSLDAIIVRLPQDPQAAPPWDIEGPFWAGDAQKTLETANRICINDGQIVLLLWQLRKTSRMVMDFAGMGSKSGNDRKRQALITDAPANFGLTVAQRTAKKVGLDTALKVSETVAEYDRMIRGGSRIDNRVLLESLLIKCTEIIKKGTTK